MSHIGTEALPLFGGDASGRAIERLAYLADAPGMMGELPGAKLRDDALQAHHANHAQDIQRVRLSLLAACRIGGLTEVTADDASVIADQLGIPGDRRWLGSVFRGWDRVRVTDRTVPSRLPRRHHRRVVIWQVL